MASLDMVALSVGAEVDMGRCSFPRGQIENWGHSGAVVTSPRADACTDVDTDDRNHAVSFSALVGTLDSGLLPPWHWSLDLLSSFWLVLWCCLRLCVWIHLPRPGGQQEIRRCYLFAIQTDRMIEWIFGVDKEFRRSAQNREAARKSRLKKKVGFLPDSFSLFVAFFSSLW